MRARVLMPIAALSLTLMLPGAAGAAGGGHAVATTEHDRIVAFWTPVRIAAAKPRDFVRESSGRIVPSAKPVRSEAVTGASWKGDGEVEKRVGRILFSSGDSYWICSGTVVGDGGSNGYSVVLTAGHCIYDGTDGWSTNFVFYPSFDDEPIYDCSVRVNGCWTATRFAINDDFYPSGFGPSSALRVDYGFAFFGTNSAGELDALVGGYPLKTSGVSLTDVQWAFGYPAEGRYKGTDLIYCKGSTINDPYDVGTWGMACNMNGGSSGGGWLFGTSNPADGSGQLSSVNSYGYRGLTYMFGPRFTAETNVVLADVIDGGATSGVSIVH